MCVMGASLSVEVWNLWQKLLSGVGTRGMRIVRMWTSSCIFLLRVMKFRFAASAGVRLQKPMWSGETL